MAKVIRLRQLLFHQYGCVKVALPALRAEIQALPDGTVVTFSNVTSVVKPSIRDVVDTGDKTYGELSVEMARCSNSACSVKQKATEQKTGWISVQLLT